MLAIRMRRTGRKGHAQFRVIVQDSRFSPSSGRVVAYLGSYDPHAKTSALDKDKIESFLKNGAQPSDRSARLFKSEGIKLPPWLKEAGDKKSAIRHPEKLRRNRPAESAKAEPTEHKAPAESLVTVDKNPETSPAEEASAAEETHQPTPAEEPAEPLGEEAATPKQTANEADQPAIAADKSSS